MLKTVVLLNIYVETAKTIFLFRIFILFLMNRNFKRTAFIWKKSLVTILISLNFFYQFTASLMNKIYVKKSLFWTVVYGGQLCKTCHHLITLRDINVNKHTFNATITSLLLKSGSFSYITQLKVYFKRVWCSGHRMCFEPRLRSEITTRSTSSETNTSKLGQDDKLHCKNINLTFLQHLTI